MQNHKGYDCFVFPRQLIPFLNLYLRSAFVGYPPIGNAFKDALACVASEFRVVRGKHYTFHLGVKNGGWAEQTEYEFYNRKAARQGEADFISILNGNNGGQQPGSASSVQRKKACKAAKQAIHDGDSSVTEKLRNLPDFVFPLYPTKPEWQLKYESEVSTERST